MTRVICSGCHGLGCPACDGAGDAVHAELVATRGRLAAAEAKLAAVTVCLENLVAALQPGASPAGEHAHEYSEPAVLIADGRWLARRVCKGCSHVEETAAHATEQELRSAPAFFAPREGCRCAECEKSTGQSK